MINKNDKQLVRLNNERQRRDTSCWSQNWNRDFSIDQSFRHCQDKKKTIHKVVVVVSSLNHVWLFVIPWTVTRQIPLSLEFSTKNTGVGFHFLLRGFFPTQGWNLCFLHCLCVLHCRWILYHGDTREAYKVMYMCMSESTKPTVGSLKRPIELKSPSKNFVRQKQYKEISWTTRGHSILNLKDIKIYSK